MSDDLARSTSHRRARSTSPTIPGRPDGVIDGLPGAMLVIISGPSGVGKDTIIDAMPAARPRPGVPLRRDLHDPSAAAGRGRRRRLPLPEPRRVPAPARRPPAARGQRGPRQLVRLAARPGPRGGRWPVATPSSRSTCRAPSVVKEQVSEAVLIFVVPPSLETLFSRLRARATETADELELRQAQRRHRAGPPGRLRLRGRQRDRPGRADRRADRRDHRRGAASATRTDASGSSGRP